MGWGSPLHAWIATVNLIAWARCPNTRKIFMRPVACTKMINCLDIAKTNTAITTWFKIIADIINMHASKFRRRYRAVAEQQRHKLNMFYKRTCIFSPTARVKFATENCRLWYDRHLGSRRNWVDYTCWFFCVYCSIRCVSENSQCIFEAHMHWQDKMVSILQTTFSNAYSWMKSFVFRWKFQ